MDRAERNKEIRELHGKKWMPDCGVIFRNMEFLIFSPKKFRKDLAFSFDCSSLIAEPREQGNGGKEKMGEREGNGYPAGMWISQGDSGRRNRSCFVR